MTKVKSFKTGSAAERRAKGVLLPTKRLGPGKYRRAWVKSPKAVKKGEALQAMWDREWEEAEVNPTRWAHIQWKSERQETDGQVKIALRGRFFSEADIEKKAREKLHRWTGELKKSDEADTPSPGLVLVKFMKEPQKGIKHNYDPKRTTKVGRYGLGYGVKLT